MTPVRLSLNVTRGPGTVTGALSVTGSHPNFEARSV